MYPNWLDSALHAHLVRLLATGAASILIGLSICFYRREWRPFGAMTVAWGVVDGLIAVTGLPNPSVGNPHTFRQFLTFNLGLNVAYVAVGATMVLLADERRRTREFGWAVAIQGFLLLALDGYLLTSLAPTVPD
jgi:hypothetical protein